MDHKKEISKYPEVIQRKNEFEQVGDNGYFFKGNYTKGYTISLEPEIQHGNVKTGRIIVPHTQNVGKRNLHGKLQFVFRNLWDIPFSDYDYIQELEVQILELKTTGRKLQEQLAEYHGPLNDTQPPQDSPKQLQQEITILESENQALKAQIAALTKKI